MMKLASIVALSFFLSAVSATEPVLTGQETPTTPHLSHPEQVRMNMLAKENSECGLCLWGTEKIEQFLAANYTETKIETAVTNLCNTLPGKYSSFCLDVIASNVPTIINDLEAYESPDTICHQLHVCNDEQLSSFHQYFSTPHMYGLMMFFKEQLSTQPEIRDYVLNTVNQYCF